MAVFFLADRQAGEDEAGEHEIGQVYEQGGKAVELHPALDKEVIGEEKSFDGETYDKDPAVFPGITLQHDGKKIEIERRREDVIQVIYEIIIRRMEKPSIVGPDEVGKIVYQQDRDKDTDGKSVQPFAAQECEQKAEQLKVLKIQ